MPVSVAPRLPVPQVCRGLAQPLRAKEDHRWECCTIWQAARLAPGFGPRPHPGPHARGSPSCWPRSPDAPPPTWPAPCRNYAIRPRTGGPSGTHPRSAARASRIFAAVHPEAADVAVILPSPFWPPGTPPSWPGSSPRSATGSQTPTTSPATTATSSCATQGLMMPGRSERSGQTEMQRIAFRSHWERSQPQANRCGSMKRPVGCEFVVGQTAAETATRKFQRMSRRGRCLPDHAHPLVSAT